MFELFFILTETNIIIYLLEKVPVNHGNLERLSCYKFQRIQPELEVIQEETCTNVQTEEKDESQRRNDYELNRIKMVVLKNGKCSIVSILMHKCVNGKKNKKP